MDHRPGPPGHRHPYITSTIRRFGDWVLDLNPPAEASDGHLALASAG